MSWNAFFFLFSTIMIRSSLLVLVFLTLLHWPMWRIRSKISLNIITKYNHQRKYLKQINHDVKHDEAIIKSDNRNYKDNDC